MATDIFFPEGCIIALSLPNNKEMWRELGFWINSQQNAKIRQLH